MGIGHTGGFEGPSSALLKKFVATLVRQAGGSSATLALSNARLKHIVLVQPLHQTAHGGGYSSLPVNVGLHVSVLLIRVAWGFTGQLFSPEERCQSRLSGRLASGTGRVLGQVCA